jgi:hypothetical protein
MSYPVYSRQQLQSLSFHRGSGRIFSALTMSANNPLTVNGLSADRQHDRVDDTDNASAVTLEKVLLTTR